MHLSVCPNFFRVRHSPSILRPILQRSRQRFEIGQHLCRMFPSSLPHLCAPTLPHLCHIFAACLLFWVHSGRSHLCHIFAASLVASCGVFCRITRLIFTASWLLATPGFTGLHKAPYLPKCPHFTSVQKHDISKKCPNHKNEVCPKMPFYKTLDCTGAPRKAKHCIAIVTWAWSPARSLGLVPGGGACVWGLGGAWSGAWAVALDCAWLGTYLVCPGLCLRWLASARPPGHGTPQSFHTEVLWLHEQLRPTRFPTLPSESFIVLEAARGHAATRFSNVSVRKCREDSFLRSAEESLTPEIFNPAARE